MYNRIIFADNQLSTNNIKNSNIQKYRQQLTKQMDIIQQINIQLTAVNEELVKLYEDHSYKSMYLSFKHFSRWNTKIYTVMESGTTIADKHRNKEIFLTMFRSYVNNFINNYVFHNIVKITNDQQFLEKITKIWQYFKRFVFHHSSFLVHAKQYYETAYKILENNKFEQKSRLDIKSNESIYPVAVIAVHTFKMKILQPFRNRIVKIIENKIGKERQYILSTNEKERLNSMFEMIWSCGLGELARITYFNQKVIFICEDRPEFLKIFKHNNQYFKKYIFQNLLQSTSMFYAELYQLKISKISSLEQISTIASYIQREQSNSNIFFKNKEVKENYMQVIYYQLILKQTHTFYFKENGLKHLLEVFTIQQKENLSFLKHYFEILKKVESCVLDQYIKYIEDLILEVGQNINKKINKSKEHILSMLTLKKKIQFLANQIFFKNIKLSHAIEKCFKKLLDGIEASKNLAEYTDFVLKQCCKLKLDFQSCEERFNNVFLLLINLSARDSYLVYHQEYLSKRMLDCINDPKIEIEIDFLKKISEQYGAVSVSSHFSMIKDIENSLETTERYSNILAFSSFRWNLKIVNPAFWPDSFTKTKIKVQFPHHLQQKAKSIEELFNGENKYKFLNWKLDKGVSLFEGSFATNLKVKFQSENIYLMMLLYISQQQGQKVLYANLKEYCIKEEKSEDQKLNLAENYVLVLIENKLLLRENPNKTQPLALTEQLSINLDYALPSQHKPHLPFIIRASPDMMKLFHQNTVEQSKILKERQKLIEAVLVKMLKHSHSSGGNCITFGQLYKGIREHPFLGNFNYAESIVKQRLEELISKEYCIRDEHDRKIYHYIA